MSASPLRLIVLARDQREGVQSAWRELAEFLSRREGVEVLATGITEDIDAVPPETDMAVVLGGDGAILRACRQFDARQVPILGVNLGRLGFLADVSPLEFRDRFDELLRRQYEVRDHLMFRVTVRPRGSTGDGEETFLGLNELAITSASLHMIEVAVGIDGQGITTYAGDGLIVSTPVGSTAHNLSAGGPILRQDMAAFVITPLNPHTLTIRPLVDRADATYTLMLPRDCDGATAVIDGQIRRPFTCRDEVVLTRAEVSCKLVKLPGSSFYATLHDKLGWGGTPRYRR